MLLSGSVTIGQVPSVLGGVAKPRQEVTSELGPLGVEVFPVQSVLTAVGSAGFEVAVCASTPTLKVGVAPRDSAKDESSGQYLPPVPRLPAWAFSDSLTVGQTKLALPGLMSPLSSLRMYMLK